MDFPYTFLCCFIVKSALTRKEKLSHKKPDERSGESLDRTSHKVPDGISNGTSNEGSLTDKKLAIEICAFLEEKKALRVLLLDLHKVNSYFKYFLIASAHSVLHLSSLAHEISKGFAKNKRHTKSTGNIKNTKKRSHISLRHQNLPLRESHSGWIVLDLIDADIVVHLFLEEQRSFYKLERLWGDADITYPKGAASLLS